MTLAAQERRLESSAGMLVLSRSLMVLSSDRVSCLLSSQSSNIFCRSALLLASVQMSACASVNGFATGVCRRPMLLYV